MLDKYKGAVAYWKVGDVEKKGAVAALIVDVVTLQTKANDVIKIRLANESIEEVKAGTLVYRELDDQTLEQMSLSNPPAPFAVDLDAGRVYNVNEVAEQIKWWKQRRIRRRAEENLEMYGVLHFAQYALLIFSIATALFAFVLSSR